MGEHDPKLVEAVARAIAQAAGAPNAMEPSSLGWTGFADEATAALDAIAAQGLVVVPREPSGFITSQSPMTFHPMPPTPKEHKA